MMKTDASEQLSMVDGNNIFNIEQNKQEKKGYFKELCESFYLIYLKHKWFDDKYWKLAFCSSPFEFINKYPSIILIYRTLLFALALFDLIHGLINANPVHEWAIYYTHLTLLITFLAVIFQFLTTYRVNFYRGDDIVPRHCLQYIHIMLILISLGSGLSVCLSYWIIIYNPSARLYYPKIILEHGILWLLVFIDIFFFTRLPIYMIDCIPFIIFAFIYGLFTVIIFIFKPEFSNKRIGYVYHAMDLNNSPLRVTILMFLFVFIMPIGIFFIFWNLFRLRRSIHVKITNEKEEQSLN